MCINKCIPHRHAKQDMEAAGITCHSHHRSKGAAAGGSLRTIGRLFSTTENRSTNSQPLDPILTHYPHASDICDIRDIRSARISLEIQHQVYLHLSVIKTRLLALRLTQPLYISGGFFLALRDLWVSWRPKPVHRIHSCGGSQRFLICHGDPRSPFPSGGVQKYNTHLIMMISNLETTIKAPAAERGLQLLS